MKKKEEEKGIIGKKKNARSALPILFSPTNSFHGVEKEGGEGKGGGCFGGRGGREEDDASVYLHFRGPDPSRGKGEKKKGESPGGGGSECVLCLAC